MDPVEVVLDPEADLVELDMEDPEEVVPEVVMVVPEVVLVVVQAEVVEEPVVVVMVMVAMLPGAHHELASVRLATCFGYARLA